MRPRVLGYLRILSAEPAESLAYLTDKMRRFAECEGLALGDIYMHHPDRQPNHVCYRSAFSAMLEALRDAEFQGVVIPALGHLSGVAALDRALCPTIEAKTGARVYVMSSSEIFTW